MAIQDYRKYRDQKYREFLTEMELDKNGNPSPGVNDLLFSPEKRTGIGMSPNTLASRRNAYKDLARHNSRHIYGGFRNTEDGEFLPMNTLAQDASLLSNKQYQLYNKTRNDRQKNNPNTVFDFTLEEQEDNQFLYPIYDKDIVRPDGGKGDWIMAASKKKRDGGLDQIAQTGMDIYNVTGESPEDRSVVGNFRTGFWNSALSMTTGPINMTEWIVDMMGRSAASIMGQPYLADYSEDGLDKFSKEWTEFMETFGTKASSKSVMADPRGMESFQEGFGQAMGSLMQYGLMGAPGVAGAKAVGMTGKGAYLLGMLPASVALTGSEAYKVAAENGLSEQDRGYFVLGYTLIAAAIELSGANVIPSYMVGNGGARQMAKMFGKELGTTITPNTMTRAATKTFAQTLDDIGRYYNKITATPFAGAMIEEAMEEGTQSLTLSLSQILYDKYAADPNSEIGKGRFGKYYNSEIWKDAIFDSALGAVAGLSGGSISALSHRKSGNHTIANYVAGNREKEMMTEALSMMKSGAIDNQQYGELVQRVQKMVEIRESNPDLFNSFLVEENYKARMAEAVNVLASNSDFIETINNTKKANPNQNVDLTNISSIEANVFTARAIDNILAGTDKEFKASLQENKLPGYARQLEAIQDYYNLLPKAIKSPQYRALSGVVLREMAMRDQVMMEDININDIITQGFESILEKEGTNKPSVTKGTLRANEIKLRMSELQSLAPKQINKNEKNKKEAEKNKIKLKKLYDTLNKRATKYIDNRTKDFQKELDTLKEEGITSNDDTEQLIRAANLASDIANSESRKIQLDTSAETLKFYENKKNLETTMKEHLGALKEEEAAKEKKKENKEKSDKRKSNIQSSLDNEAKESKRAQTDMHSMAQKMNDPNITEEERTEAKENFLRMTSQIEEESPRGTESEVLMGLISPIGSEELETADSKVIQAEQALNNANGKEAFGKTTITNMAYLHNEYEVVNTEDGHTFLKSIYKEDGSIVQNPNSNRRMSLPTYMKVGTNLVLFVDTENDAYDVNKNTLGNVPIAIMTEEEFNNKKKPSAWLHNLGWIAEIDSNDNLVKDNDGNIVSKGVANSTVAKVFSETKSIRNMLFRSELSQEKIFESTVITKGTGRNNHSKLSKSAIALMKADSKLFLGIGARNEIHTSFENGLDKVSETLKLYANAGVIYLFFPNAIGTYSMSRLTQRTLEDNKELYKKYSTIVSELIFDYIEGGSITDGWSLDRLVKEVSLYVHSSFKTKSGLSEEKANADIENAIENNDNVRKNLVFNFFESEKGDFIINLPHETLSFAVLKTQVNDAGKKILYTTNVIDKKAVLDQEVSKEDFFNMLFNEVDGAIRKKFPNVVKENIEEIDESFTYFDLNSEGNMVRKEGSYLDFLHENDILDTNIEPIEVDGELTYTSQPNIGINPKVAPLGTKDISEFETTRQTLPRDAFAKPKRRKKRKPIEGLDEETSNSIITNTQTVSNLIKEASQNLDKLNIGSFTFMKNLIKEDDMVKAMTKRYLEKQRLLPIREGQSASEYDRIVMEALLDEMKAMSISFITEGEAELQRAFDEDEILDAKDKLTAGKSYKILVDNFYPQLDKQSGKVFIGYKSRILNELEGLTFTVEKGDLESEGEYLEKSRFIEDWNLKRDPEKSAAGRVRRFLYFIKNTTIEKNALNEYKMHNHVEVFNSILTNLADIPINEMEEALESLSQIEVPTVQELEDETLVFTEDDMVVHNPMMYNVNIALKEAIAKEPGFRNEFFSIMHKHNNIMKVILYTPSKKGYTSGQFAIKNSNSRGTVNVVIDRWRNKFRDKAIRSGLVITNHNTNTLIIDKKKAKAMRDRFMAIQKASFKAGRVKTFEKYVSFFNDLGIDISTQTLRNIANDRKFRKTSYFFKKYFKGDTTSTFFMFIQKEFGYLVDSFISETKDELKSFEDYNPFYKNTKELGILARYYLREHPDTYATSFKAASNEKVWGFVEASYITDRMQRFTSADGNFISLKKNNKYSSRSSWLEEIENTRDGKSKKGRLISYSIFDASKNIKNFEGAVNYNRQSLKEREVTRLNLFLNNDGSDGAHYLYITPSDKSRIPIITAPRERFLNKELNKITVFKEGTINLENTLIIDKLYNMLVMSEVDRINEVIRQFNGVLPENRARQLKKGYHYIGDELGLGAMFNLIPELNSLESIYIDPVNGIDISNVEAKEIKKFLANYFENMAHERVAFWEANNIVNIENENTLVDFKSLRSALNKVPNSSKKLTDAVNLLSTEYVTNYALAIANISMIFTGDPALFAKVPKNWTGDRKSLIDSSVANMFKRTAKDIAPGPEGVWKGTSNIIKYAFAKSGEINIDASRFNDMLSKYMAKKYDNIDHTDGVEYITAKEYVNTLYAFGKITDEIREAVLNDLENDRDLNPFLLGHVMNPLKQVYVDSEIAGINMEDGSMASFEDHFYIKSSSVPLIPQLTRQFPNLDNLRKSMEGPKGGEGIVDRLVVTSASKISVRDEITVFQENGDFLEKIDFKSHVIGLDRKGLRTQQENPHKPKKKENIRGSQFSVLQYGDIESTVQFDLGRFGNFDASQLYKLDGTLTSELYKRKFENLLRELGLVKIPIIKEDREYHIYEPSDLNRIKNLLIEEATTRAGYSYNDLLFLNILEDVLNEDIQSFEIPLFFHSSVNKIEALLNSLISNNVLKRKLPGKSYIQEPMAGFFKGMPLTEKFAKDYYAEQIIFTESYDPVNGLRYSEDENGIYAEVFIPFYFKGKDGNPLNITEYVKDGFIDTEKIDNSLLELISYRIPTQNKSSMIRLKVAGFLPASAGDLVIVPAEIGRQSGSDYDIDKLFTHHFNYTIEENNKLSKLEITEYNDITDVIYNRSNLSEQQIQNTLLDISMSLMRDKDFMYSQVQTLDTNTMEEVGDEIDKLEKTSSQRETTIIDIQTQEDAVEMGASGQLGIAISSLSSVSHVYRQYANIYIGDRRRNDEDIATNTVQFLDENGNVYQDKFHGKDFVKNRVVPLTSNDIAMAMSDGAKNYEDIPYRAGINGAWRLDKIYGFSNAKISEVIKDIQNASVDNASNPQLHRLNLGNETFDIALLIASLGFDLRFIGYFLRQPVIKEFINAKLENRGFIKGDYDKNTVTEYIDKVYKEADVDIEDMQAVTAFSLEELKVQLASEERSKLMDAQLLYNYMEWKKLAEDLGEVQSTFNTQTKGLGKSIYSTIYKNRRAKYLATDKSTIKNVSNLIAEDTVTGGAYIYGIKEGSLIYNSSKLLPLHAKVLDHVTSEIARIRGIRGELDENLVNAIMTDVRNAVYSSTIPLIFNSFDDIAERSLYDIRQSFLFGEDSLANRLFKMQENTTNPLIKVLLPIISDELEKPNRIEYIASRGMNETEILKMQSSFKALLDAPKDSDEFKMGRDLMIYTFLIGNERNPKDFGSLIPIDAFRMFKDTGGTSLSEHLYNTDFHQGSGLAKLILENYVKQWFQHNPFRAKIAHVDDFSKSITVDGDRRTDTNPIYKFSLKHPEKKGSKTGRLRISEGIKGGHVFADYLSFYDKASNRIFLYAKSYTKDHDVEYVLIPTLGFKSFYIKEYDLHEENQQSVLADNIEKLIQRRIEERRDYIPPSEAQKMEEVLMGTLSKPLRKTRSSGKSVIESIGFLNGPSATLQTIADNGTSPEFKAWAKFLLSKKSRVNIDKYKNQLYNIDNESHWDTSPIGENYPSPRVREQEMQDSLRGRVIHKNRSILLNPGAITTKHSAEAAFLHEILHVHLDYMVKNFQYLNKQEQTAVRSLKAIIAKLRLDGEYISSLEEGGEDSSDILYGLGVLSGNEIRLDSANSVSEFISVLVSNEKFQNDLNNKLFSKHKSMISRIIDVILNLFGITLRRNHMLAESFANIFILFKDNSNYNRVSKAKESAKRRTAEKRVAESITKVKYIPNISKAQDTARNGEGIYTMRVLDNYNIPGLTEKFNYGNPWSSKEFKHTITVHGPSESARIKLAVQNYEDWLDKKDFLEISPERRDWILAKIESGELTGKDLIYFRTGYRSHADVLLEKIQKRFPEVEKESRIPEQDTGDTDFETERSKNTLPSGFNLGMFDPSNSIIKKATESQKIADRKQNHISILKNKRAQKGANTEAISARISRLRQQVRLLRLEQKNARMERALVEDISSSRNIVRMVADGLEPGLSREDYQVMADALANVQYYLDTWENVKDLIQYRFNDESAQKIINKSDELEKLKKTKIKLTKQLILDSANTFSFRNNFEDKELFEGIKDSSVITSHTLGLKHSNPMLLKVAHDMIQSMQNSFNLEYYSKKMEIQKKVKTVISETGLTKTDLWEKMIQKTEDGNRTGNYISKYKPEYIVKREELYKEAKEEKKWKKYWKFIRDNNKHISPEMVKGEEQGFFTDEQFEEQKDKYKSYKMELEFFKEDLLANPEMFNEETKSFVSKRQEYNFGRLVEAWVTARSPMYYVEGKFNPNTRFKGKEGGQYVVHDTPIDEWIDPRYNELQSNDKVYEFYKFMVNTINKNSSLLPYTTRLPGNYIPELSRSMVENFNDTNMIGIISGMASDMKEAMWNQADQLIDTSLKMGNKKIKFIPVQMMNNRLETKEKSYDLEKVLLANTAVAMGYKHKSQTEPLVDAILQMISTMNEGEVVEIGSKLIPKEDKYGQVSETVNPLKNSRAHLEGTMKAIFYDDYKNKNNLFKKTTQEESKRISEIKKILENTTNLSEREELIKELNTLGKHFNGNILVDTLVTWTYAVGLGFPNLISPAVNMFYGIVSNFTYAAAGEYVTDANLVKGTTMMMRAVSRRMVNKFDRKNLIKVYGFMDSFDLLTGIVESNYGGVRKFTDMLVKFQTKAEYINQGSLMIGMLKTMMMKDKNGKDIAMWDAFTLDDNNALVWDTNRMGEYKLLEGKDMLSENKNSLNLHRLRILINSEIAKVHGDYESVMVGKRIGWFRLAMLFKTWLPESFNHRFGKLWFNPDTQKWEKGRYLSIATAKDLQGESISTQQSLLSLVSNMYKFSQKNSFKEFSDMDRVNMARNVREMQFVLTLTIISLMLFAAAKGDDDKTIPAYMKAFLFLLIKVLNKSKDDLALYFDPRSSLQIVANIFPTVSLLAKAASLVDVAYNTMSGNGTIEAGPFKGMNKILKNTLEITPGGAGAIRMYRDSNQLPVKY